MPNNVEIVLLGRDETSGVFQKVSGTLSGALGGVSKVAGIAQTALGFVAGGVISKGLDLIGGAVSGIADAMIGGNAEFERYETQFGVLLGSTKAAKDRLADLAEFGAKTPFELPEVVRADKILQAFGLHSEESAKKFGMSGTDIRTVAGDVAAGTGASFEEISTYLGKFASGATGEAISRMQELGIVTRQQLTEMGLKFSKSGELVSPLDKSMSVLLKSMKDKFGGMMDAQSSTFEGMMSNLQDWLGQTGRIIGAPIFDVLKESLGGLLKILGSDTVKNALAGFAQGAANAIKGTIDWFKQLATDVGPVIDAIGDFFSALSAGEKVAFDSSDEMSRFAEVLANLGIPDDLAMSISDVIGGIITTVQSGINAIAEFFGRIQNAWSTLVKNFEAGGLARVFTVFEDMSGAFSDFLQALGMAEGPATELSLAIHRIIVAAEGISKAFNIGGLQRVFTVFEDGAGAFSDFLQTLGFGEDASINISLAIQRIIDAAIGLSKAFDIGGLQRVFTVFEDMSGSFSDFLQTLGIGEDAAIAISLAFQHVVTTVNDVISAFQIGSRGGRDLVEGFASALNVLGQINPLFSQLGDVVVKASYLIDGLVATITGSETSFGDWSSWFEDMTDAVGPEFANTVDGIIKAVFGIKTMFDAVLPELQAFAGDLITAITSGDTGPLLARVQEWTGILLNWITTDVIPFIGNKISELATTIGGLISTYAPVIIDKLIEWESAWLNFLVTGVIPFIGDKISDLVTAIGTWITTYGPGIVTQLGVWATAFLNFLTTSVLPFIGAKIGELVSTIGSLITTYVPVIVDALVAWESAYLNFLATNVIPFIGQKIGELVTAIGSLIVTYGPVIVAQLATWAGAFLNWVDTAVVPQIGPKLETIGAAIGTWISGAAATIGTQISAWAASFTGWIEKDVLPTLPEKLLAFWTTLYTWIHDTASNIQQNSAQLATQITAWIGEKAIPWLRTEFPKFVLVLVGLLVAIPVAIAATLAVVALGIVNGIVDGIKTKITEKATELLNIGKDIIAGMLEGLKADAQKIVDFLGSLVTGAIDKVKDILHIPHSPSGVFMDIGDDMVLGVVNRLKAGVSAVKGAVIDLMGGAMEGVNSFTLPPIRVPGVALDAGSVSLPSSPTGLQSLRDPKRSAFARSASYESASNLPQTATVNVYIDGYRLEPMLAQMIYSSLQGVHG